MPPQLGRNMKNDLVKELEQFVQHYEQNKKEKIKEQIIEKMKDNAKKGEKYSWRCFSSDGLDIVKDIFRELFLKENIRSYGGKYNDELFQVSYSFIDKDLSIEVYKNTPNELLEQRKRDKLWSY